MSGEATSEERIGVADGLIKTLKEMDFDTRESVTILFVAVVSIWKDQRLPVPIFDKMVAATRKTIVENWKEVS